MKKVRGGGAVLRRDGEALLGVVGLGLGAGDAGLPPIAFADDDGGHTAAVAGEKHLGTPLLFSGVFAGAATAFRHVVIVLTHGFLLLYLWSEVCSCCRPKPRSYSHFH